jgi:hypothetical protein
MLWRGHTWTSSLPTSKLNWSFEPGAAPGSLLHAAPPRSGILPGKLRRFCRQRLKETNNYVFFPAAYAARPQSAPSASRASTKDIDYLEQQSLKNADRADSGEAHCSSPTRRRRF